MRPYIHNKINMKLTYLSFHPWQMCCVVKLWTHYCLTAFDEGLGSHQSPTNWGQEIKDNWLFKFEIQVYYIFKEYNKSLCKNTVGLDPTILVKYKHVISAYNIF